MNRFQHGLLTLLGVLALGVMAWVLLRQTRTVGTPDV